MCKPFFLWFGSTSLAINEKENINSVITAPVLAEFCLCIGDVLTWTSGLKWTCGGHWTCISLQRHQVKECFFFFLLVPFSHVVTISFRRDFLELVAPHWLWMRACEQSLAASTRLDVLHLSLLLPFYDVYLFVKMPQYFCLVSLLISVDMFSYPYSCFRLKISKHRS